MCTVFRLSCVVCSLAIAADTDAALRLNAGQRRILCHLKRHTKLSLHHKDSQDEVDGRVIFAHGGHQGTSRCAIVSSSGALLWHAFGPEIDSHDVVIRFNDAPAGFRFTPYVGKKTSVRITGMKGFHRLGYQKGVRYINAAAAGNDSREMMQKVPSESLFLFQEDPRSQIQTVLQRALPRRWIQVGMSTGKSFQPTMGAVGTILALQFCDQVDLYDMTPSIASFKAPYHYYRGRYIPSRKLRLKKQLGADNNTWHIGFTAEKHMWASLSVTNRSEVRRTGKARLLGFSALACGNSTEDVLGQQDLQGRPSALGGRGVRHALQITHAVGSERHAVTELRGKPLPRVVSAMFSLALLTFGFIVCLRLKNKRYRCDSSEQLDRIELLTAAERAEADYGQFVKH